MRIVIGLIVVIALVSLYFYSWNLNKRVPLPKDVKDSRKGCTSCSNLGCGIHPSNGGH